jgi:hypothetical protein
MPLFGFASRVMLMGRMKMALAMLRVTVPPRTNLVLKIVMETALMMHALAQVRGERRWSMEVFFSFCAVMI